MWADDYNALEPHIDEQTMRIHHLKHHQTYTDKLNGALQTMRDDPAYKYLAKMGVDTLLKHLDEVPDKLRGTVRNSGGSVASGAQTRTQASASADEPRAFSRVFRFSGSRIHCLAR